MKHTFKKLKNAEVQSTSETFVYALQNGYINVDKLLEPDDAIDVHQALTLLNDLESFLAQEELIEYF